MTDRVEFLVSGADRIHCASCEQRIGNALRRLAGVEEVEASARSQLIMVKFDSRQVSAEQVRARLAQIGYEVTQPGAGR